MSRNVVWKKHTNVLQQPATSLNTLPRSRKLQTASKCYKNFTRHHSVNLRRQCPTMSPMPEPAIWHFITIPQLHATFFGVLGKVITLKYNEESQHRYLQRFLCSPI